ncbi:RHS repeat domain-containing protein [Rhodanobacter ginsengisoli]|uniref:RHS repeat domain-containing protein n=1 Tax=Rhodanobacter ginsengisoli TaxID=418646 RepID=A0ABW0QPV3_9GAMM
MELAFAIRHLLSRHRALPILLLGGLMVAQAAHADSPVVTQYTYDAGDHAATVTDPRGLVTTYTHDGLGQLWQQASPDTGTTSYVYDGYGRMASMTRADGVQTTYTYDGMNRVTSVSAGGLTQSFAYDNCTNGVGRLCSDRDATGATSYTYTPEGWVAGRGFSIGGTTYAIGYGHDTVGHVTTVDYPDGNQANYTYTNGVVSSVALTVGGTVVNGATSISYQPMNLGMASWTSSNGLANSMSYDTDGRLTGINATGVESLGLTYDNADRITQLTNGINTNLTQNFGYDAMSRLVSVYSGVENESYQYDANGNRITQVVNGASSILNISATSNRIASASGAANGSYGYDAKGNTTTLSSVPTYSYDPFNRLSNAGGMSYYVNPEGQRLRKTGTAGTSYFAPDRGGAMLAEDPNGTWIDYVWLNGRLIGRVSAGTVDAVHDDQVGRPEEMTDASQAVVWRAQNYPFTQQVTVASATLNIGFPGQYYDAETGNWNNGFRDYNSGLGRYIESDPMGLGGGANTYAYVLNNPLSGSDIFGLQEDSVNKQQAEGAVQGAVNEASAVVIPDRAGAISDVGGDLAAGAIAFGSVLQSEAQYDYSMSKQDPGNHFYAKFDDMDWSQYPSFSEAWKAYLKKHMKGKKCP